MSTEETVGDGIVLETTKIRTERQEDDALWNVVLDAPKGNILDTVMTAELREVFRQASKEPKVKAIVLSAEGRHFSFGASVEEHCRDHVAGMLFGFHDLFRTIAGAGVPVVVAVRGACLGGGLELASFCQRVFAHPEASFGQPEIALGVFAPVASVILADRIGRGNADDLLLTGRTVKAQEAKDMGLVDEIVEEPEEQAREWVKKHLLPRSARSLRYAARAARCDFMRRFEKDIRDLEALYLGDLMNTFDANEGIASFLEKREPLWRDV